MKRLVVIYDDSCGFCVRCRWWLARQPAFVEYVFVPRSTPSLERLFPGLLVGEKAELILIGEQGEVYRDDAAFIMCLYGLQAYREWSLRLASPALMPLAAQFFRSLSKRRRLLSRLFGGAEDRALERLLEQRAPHACDTCVE
jgi:predicted DCC family thiol-disulfide oxidoreductase YuxK